MLQIKARINISGTTQSATITAVSNLKGNNVSGVVNDVVNKISVPLGNPFVLGRSVVGVKDTYYDKLPYYMGGQLANESGDFPEKYIITLTGKTASNYIIVFDKENNRYPNYVKVDGNVILDNAPQLELPLDDSKTTHTIEIDNWNTPDYPLIITGLYAIKDLEITQKNLESFSSNIMDRQSAEYPTYGLISNSASLSFYDFNEEALDLIITKVLHSGAKVGIWIGDDELGISEQICEMEIRELSYDNNNRKVDITLKDNLEDMQNINVQSIDYDPLNSKSQTAEWYYKKLYDITIGLNKYDILSYDELDIDTISVLHTTTIQYPLLESGNLWDSWDKLCQLCLLHMYIDNNNRVVVKYSI